MLVGGAQHAVQQVDDDRQRRRAAGRRRRSTRASSRPPLGDDRRLARDPRQRAEDDVELRVDRLDGRLERAQVLGLDALQRAAERRQALRRSTPGRGGPGSARRRARATTTTASTTLRSDEQCVWLMPLTEPVGQRVHVAVLDDRLLHDQRQHGRGRLELRDVRRVAGDLARDVEQRRRPTSRCRRRRGRARPAGPRRRAPRRGRSPARSPSSVVAMQRAERHLPTATFRSARAECRIRTPESLIRAMPRELVGLLRARPRRALDGRARLLGDPRARARRS